MLINEKEEHLYCYKCCYPHLADMAEKDVEIAELVDMLVFCYVSDEVVQFKRREEMAALINKHRNKT